MLFGELVRADIMVLTHVIPGGQVSTDTKIGRFSMLQKHLLRSVSNSTATHSPGGENDQIRLATDMFSPNVNHGSCAMPCDVAVPLPNVRRVWPTHRRCSILSSLATSFDDCTRRICNLITQCSSTPVPKPVQYSSSIPQNQAHLVKSRVRGIRRAPSSNASKDEREEKRTWHSHCLNRLEKLRVPICNRSI